MLTRQGSDFCRQKALEKGKDLNGTLDPIQRAPGTEGSPMGSDTLSSTASSPDQPNTDLPWLQNLTTLDQVFPIGGGTKITSEMVTIELLHFCKRAVLVREIV